MGFRIVAVIMVFLMGPSIGAALAQTTGAAATSATIDVRTSVKDDYVRLVFDWPALPTYSVRAIDTKTQEITFDAPGRITTKGVDLKNFPEIADVHSVSEPPRPLKIWIVLKNPVPPRILSVGNRLIVDVLRDPDQRSGSTTSPSPKNTPPKIEDTKPESVEEAKPASTPTATVSAAPEPSAPAGPLKDPSDPADRVYAGSDPVVLTLSSTKAGTAAIFRRFDRLFVLAGQSDMLVPPQATGPGAGQFPPFRRFDLAQGTLFVARVDDAVPIVVSGGGLVWSVALNDGSAPPAILDPERIDQGDGSMALNIPLANLQGTVRVTDPDTGETIIAVLAEQAGPSTGPERRFPELTLLTSLAGLALVPHSDDVSVARDPNAALITRPDGLRLADPDRIRAKKLSLSINHTPQNIKNDPEVPVATGDSPAVDTDGTLTDSSAAAYTGAPPILTPTQWTMGGLDDLRENERLLLKRASGQDDSRQVEDFVTLAKLHLAHGYGPEALGYARLAEEKVPTLAKAPEFLAIKGTAAALAGQYEESFAALRDPSLDTFPDIPIWRTYALSALEDWQQASKTLPDDLSVLETYPAFLKHPLLLRLAEVALRAGVPVRAETILKALETPRTVGQLDPRDAMDYDYLMGELKRQQGDLPGALAAWEPLIDGIDPYYATKADLASTVLKVESNQQKLTDAIDRMEGLRYSWRGDGLEMSVNSRLGDFYIRNKNYTKGFSLLRQAAEIASLPTQSAAITAEMATAYRSMFFGKELATLSPLDALTVYQEFSELVPPGAEGERLVRRLIEHLVESGFPGKAAELLTQQFTTRLQGADKTDAGLRLVTLHLLNEEPDQALRTLDAVEPLLREPDIGTSARVKSFVLKKARALSQLARHEQAIALLTSLPPDGDVLRLKADVAWRAANWVEASLALSDLVARENVAPAKPLTEDQSDLILNWAVAVNLAGDRATLATLREQYKDLMVPTLAGETFDIVTRAESGALLADRATIDRIVGDVDLFADFLTRENDAPATEPPKPPSS